MTRLFCAYCGDRLRPVRVFAVRNHAPLRMVLVDLGVEWYHTTRRYDKRYRPDTITAGRIFRRFARTRIRT